MAKKQPQSIFPPEVPRVGKTIKVCFDKGKKEFETLISSRFYDKDEDAIFFPIIGIDGKCITLCFTLTHKIWYLYGWPKTKDPKRYHRVGVLTVN